MTAYVALGDSYAAGIGAGQELAGPRRTDAGYPMDVARSTGLELAYQAVLGATTDDVLRDQVRAVTDDTELVTITVGGNDVGFVPVLLEVVKPAWFSDSEAAIDLALSSIREVLHERLTSLIERVRWGAPGARVVVTAYPRLFNGESDCSWLSFVSPEEMRRLDHAADELATVILTAAEDTGCDGVDLRGPFDGHQVCDPVEWIHGLSVPLEESYHPNASGHRAYGEGVIARLESAATQAERLQREPQVCLGECQGSAPTFALPDLMSEASLVGALRHGLDPDRVADRARCAQDEARTQEERRAAAAELQEMDAQVRSGRSG